MRMSLRVISFFMCLAVLLASITVSAFATDGQEIPATEGGIPLEVTEIEAPEQIEEEAELEDIMHDDLCAEHFGEFIGSTIPYRADIEAEPAVNAAPVISSTAAQVKEAIVYAEPFEINGYIQMDGEPVQLSEIYDFSKASRFNIAQWSENVGIITEAEKIECYCQLMVDKNFENEFCLTSAVENIMLYAENNVVSRNVADMIEEITYREAGILMDQVPNVSVTSTEMPNELICDAGFWYIHFDQTQITRATVLEVEDFLIDISDEYEGMGFDTPILETGEEHYHIYLDPLPNPENSTTQGVTFKRNINGNKCASYIRIYNFSVLNEDAKHTIAHEYFHAIQNAYNHHSSWLKEAMAQWGD